MISAWLKFCARPVGISNAPAQSAMESIRDDFRIGMFESAWMIRAKRAREPATKQVFSGMRPAGPMHDAMKMELS